MLFQAFTLEAFIKSGRMPGLFTQRLELKALHFHITLTFRPPPHISLSPCSCEDTILQIKCKESWFSHLTLTVLHLTFSDFWTAVILVRCCYRVRMLFTFLKFYKLLVLWEIFRSGSSCDSLTFSLKSKQRVWSVTSVSFERFPQTFHGHLTGYVRSLFRTESL